MVHGRTSKAFNYIYIKQGKYNKLAPMGRLISPSMGLKAGRGALKTGTRCSELRPRLSLDRDEWL